MISKQVARFIHLGATRIALGANKSNLAKLRKKTGYPFGNCKKALEANNNNIEQAEKWLEEQAKSLGWSKAMKLVSRNTPQGLVGIVFDKHCAAMVEVNCETDFVARNEKFQKLVDLVAKTCLHHTKNNPSLFHSSDAAKETTQLEVADLQNSVVTLTEPTVGKLMAGDNQSLADHVARAIGVVGERMVVRRAALVAAQSPLTLATLTHPTTSGPLMGKYGAVLLYTANSHNDKTSHLAKQLCQHVIGMNPSTVEPSPDADITAVKPEPVAREKVVSDIGDGIEGEEGLEVGVGEESETSMMRQAFLLDPERTVADVVAEAGIQIHRFVRFECGEGLAEAEEETPVKVAQAGG